MSPLAKQYSRFLRTCLLVFCSFIAGELWADSAPGAEPTLDDTVSKSESLDSNNSPSNDTKSEDSTTDTEPPESFEGSVTVTAESPGYVARDGGSAGKTSMSLLETPQSVTVLTREHLDDLAGYGLQDALNYAAGVRSDAYGLDSRSDAFFVRGANPDTYLDGMRRHLNFYTSSTRIEPFLLERIEVLRGPSSMLYGQGTTAGLVNMISKRPSPGSSYDVGVQLGSFDRRQAQADLNGALDGEGKWLYRVVAVARQADTQVDHVPDDRLLIAPSITWAPNDRTQFTFQMRLQEDRSGSTAQFLPWQGSILDNPNGRVPLSTFIGDPENDRYDSDRLSLGWLLEHHLNDYWTLRQNLRWVDNRVEYRALYADAFVRPGNSFLDPNQRIIGRFGFFSDTDVQMWTADQHVEGQFETGSVSHRLLIGVDTLRFKETGTSASDSPDYIGGGVPAIDLYNPVHSPYTSPTLSPDPDATQQQVGVYIQDQIGLGQRWQILAGLRYDRTDNELEGAVDEDTDATTGRLGILYAAENGFAPYISYSESFTPVTGTNVENQRFDPLRGEQVELGLRYEPKGRAFRLAAAVYELKEKNRLISDPNNPLNQIQAGSTETSGFELEAAGMITRGLELSAHYNQLDNDEQLDALPEHQAGLWLHRDVELQSFGRLALSLGARYFSAFQFGNAPEVPELTLFDAQIGWSSGPWSLNLTLQNLEDETYVTTCLPRGDCFYGSGRTALLTTGARF